MYPDALTKDQATKVANEWVDKQIDDPAGY